MRTVLQCACGCGEPATFAATHVHQKLKTGTKFTKWESRDMGFSSPCHVWTGAVNSARRGRRGGEYGKIYLHGRYVGAHRAIYELEVGKIPDGYEIHHLCGVTLCVNTAHLIPVTPSQHTRFAANVKLDDDTVRAIRTTKVRAQDWADLLGVSKSLISQVRAGTIWKHVT